MSGRSGNTGTGSTFDRRDLLKQGAAWSLLGTLGIPTLGARESAAAELPKGGHLRIGHAVYPLPQLAHRSNVASANNVLRQVCETLTRLGQDNVVRPHLLEDLTVSDDLKTWTLKLRRDVKWRSGRPFVAEDVIWNLKHVLDPAVGSNMLGYFKPLFFSADGTSGPSEKAIEKIDAHTVQLTLRTPTIAMPVILAEHSMPILDPEERGEFKIGMNGTGPFALVEYEPTRRALFEANKNYWGVKPHLDKLEFIDVGDSPMTALAALRSGQVDGLYLLDVAGLPLAQQIPNVKIYEVATAETAIARMKVGTKPFDDVRVRKAMKLAVDQTQVLAVAMAGKADVAEHHLVSPIHPEYFKLPFMGRDVEKAKALLKEAGLPNGFSTEMVVSQTPAWLIPAANVLVNQWADINVKVTVKPVPSSVYNADFLKIPFGLTRWAHRPPGFSLIGLILRSGAPYNETDYANPKLDALISQAEATYDLEKRKLVMKDIEELLQEDAPFAQPIWARIMTAYSSRVQGFKMHPVGFIYAEELALAPA